VREEAPVTNPLAAGRARPAPGGPSSRPGGRPLFDITELIDAIVDEATFFPYKDLFAPELVCASPASAAGRSACWPTSRSHKAGVLFSDSSDRGGPLHLDL